MKDIKNERKKKIRLDRESNRLTFAMTAHNALSIVTLIKATGEQATVSL